MLALAGLPGTTGFIGKLFLIEAAVEGDYTWLGVAIVVGTMISLAYYLRVVAAVWMRPAAKPVAGEEVGDRGRGAQAAVADTPPRGTRCMLIIVPTILVAAATVVFGIYPDPLVDWASAAGESLGAISWREALQGWAEQRGVDVDEQGQRGTSAQRRSEVSSAAASAARCSSTQRGAHPAAQSLIALSALVALTAGREPVRAAALPGPCDPEGLAGDLGETKSHLPSGQVASPRCARLPAAEFRAVSFGRIPRSPMGGEARVLFQYKPTAHEPRRSRPRTRPSTSRAVRVLAPPQGVDVTTWPPAPPRWRAVGERSATTPASDPTARRAPLEIADARQSGSDRRGQRRTTPPLVRAATTTTATTSASPSSTCARPKPGLISAGAIEGVPGHVENLVAKAR